MTVQDSKPDVHVCFCSETLSSPTFNPLKINLDALSLKPAILLFLQVKRT